MPVPRASFLGRNGDLLPTDELRQSSSASTTQRFSTTPLPSTTSPCLGAARTARRSLTDGASSGLAGRSRCGRRGSTELRYAPTARPSTCSGDDHRARFRT
ncbi:hypothetical protein GUJ93_ZPchr0001g31123 [Zizania palustris]|uniref:Uncharacterized protein n=1 Tax=Zizania palustris TaxID=103762 RepID=A0A8J5R4W8_ZIZPA|nr:hypothetical protein GUJ93_ZPchr0001g31123 [Zizania palustris]